MNPDLTHHSSLITHHFSLTRHFFFAFAFCTVLLAAPLFPASAEEPAPFHEATRLLEEEVRLSARPQLYLLLDLPDRALIVKSHGMELRRFPIEAWSVSHESELRRLFKLQARPSVPRPKAVPGQDPTLDPIELRHMPMAFELNFDPNLTILVTPPWEDQPWLWIKTMLRDWYQRTRHPMMTHIRLVLRTEAGQSLAWVLLDGIALLVKPPQE